MRICQEENAPKPRPTSKLKLDVRSQAIHNRIKPIIASMSIDKFAEPHGTSATIESSPLRFSKGLHIGGIVPVHEHNIHDVKVLFLESMPGFKRNRYAYQEAHDMLGVPKEYIESEPLAGNSRVFPSIDRPNVHYP